MGRFIAGKTPPFVIGKGAGTAGWVNKKTNTDVTTKTTNGFFIHIPSFHPPTQETAALAVDECVTLDENISWVPHLASADSAAGRMTRRSLGECMPNRISTGWRSRVR
jgi:hypothetical protein